MGRNDGRRYNTLGIALAEEDYIVKREHIGRDIMAKFTTHQVNKGYS